MTDLWRRKLNNLWTLCKFPEEGPNKPTPHRFRHTFARILLSRPGVTVRDVAELLGNTEQMVRKHYAAWISTEYLNRVVRALQAVSFAKEGLSSIDLIWTKDQPIVIGRLDKERREASGFIIAPQISND